MKPMTVVEFISRKNTILREITGVTLVPADQILEVESKPLSSEKTSDAGICPYCVIYVGNRCIDCPMYKANNGCLNSDEEDTGTYKQVIIALNTRIAAVPEIQSLVREFNQQFTKEIFNGTHNSRDLP